MSVADLGFCEGSFNKLNSYGARTKFSWPCLLLLKTTTTKMLVSKKKIKSKICQFYIEKQWNSTVCRKKKPKILQLRYCTVALWAVGLWLDGMYCRSMWYLQAGSKGGFNQNPETPWTHHCMWFPLLLCALLIMQTSFTNNCNQTRNQTSL